ncbi:hypothetical protein FHS72_001728 [Loktanella ponticola]|uniref:Uncharacterized protein n=1 Tax=Yoonia ponticola TaxID=1524255 RepID=A0A7W9BKB8_9RHOB|nr:hypothetical protein [Yoonia ponticola]MBB5722104.1 hypothetical protein [Yoonia ponticola]
MTKNTTPIGTGWHAIGRDAFIARRYTNALTALGAPSSPRMSRALD